MRPHRTVAVLSLISVLALISLDATEADEDGKEADPWNCATISLYNILSLEGHRVSLAQLRGELGPPGEGGHSMRQIRDVAKRHGLVLDARVLPKQAAAIDRPILLFVRKGEEGHFTVVRPVGHTGKLIQSLDRDGPTVFDADVLLNSPSWTGVALVPRRLQLPGVVLLGVVLLGLAACFLLYQRSRRSRPVAAGMRDGRSHRNLRFSPVEG